MKNYFIKTVDSEGFCKREPYPSEHMARVSFDGRRETAARYTELNGGSVEDVTDVYVMDGFTRCDEDGYEVSVVLDYTEAEVLA